MTDETAKEKDKEKTPEESESQKPAGKGGFLKYIIFGVVGLVAVVGVAFGTLMVVGQSGKPSQTAASSTEIESHSESNGKSKAKIQSQTFMTAEDSLLALMDEDESVLESIMRNLEILDYVPSESDIFPDDDVNAVKDSIEQVNWLEKEKAALTIREKELDAKLKKLQVLDSKVSQKILRVEQAESGQVSKLAKLYDGMEARSVAKLIANLDDATVVSIIPRMKLKNASQVLALMPAKRAARLSKQMITIAEN